VLQYLKGVNSSFRRLWPDRNALVSIPGILHLDPPLLSLHDRVLHEFPLTSFMSKAPLPSTTSCLPSSLANFLDRTIVPREKLVERKRKDQNSKERGGGLFVSAIASF